MRQWISLCESNTPSMAEMDELCQDIKAETGAYIEAHMLDSDSIHIEYVSGGGGTGWEAIRQLCDFADAQGLKIVLSVLDSAPGLVRYYLRHGFDVDGFSSLEETLAWLADYEAKWDFDDFETHEEISMTRAPNASARPR